MKSACFGEDMDQQQTMILGAVVAELVLFGIGSIFFAIGNYFIAKRLGKNKVLWVVLTIIPGVNFIFLYYMAYQILYAILDRLPGERQTA